MLNMNCRFIILIVLAVKGHSFPTVCHVSEWQCSNGECISLSERCDNFPDCLDGSDEENCIVSPVCLEGLESCPQPNGTTVCVAKALGCSCGPVPDIAHGKIVSESKTIGSVANVTCDVGHDASTPTVLCQITGLWEAAYCIPKDCGQVYTIQFGNITVDDTNGTTYGARRNVTCNEGFETLTPVIKCQESGTWETAVCTVKDCGPLPLIAFGNITLSNNAHSTVGSLATVNCDIGYFADEQKIVCQTSGMWKKPTCSPLDCGKLPEISHGSTSLSTINNTKFGASANVVCDAGYETNVTKITCLVTGKWENAQCAAKDCGSPPKIAYGTVTLNAANNTRFQATALVTCDDNNTAFISCLSSGLWEKVVCSPKACGKVSAIQFGKISPVDDNNVTVGASANVVCDTGYEANTHTIKCQQSGKWEAVECRAKDCGPPSVISNGNITLKNVNMTSFGAEAYVICDVNFNANVSKITCQSAGVWENAKCVQKTCGSVPVIQFGSVSHVNASVTLGVSANVLCNTGYEPNTTIIKCQSSGKWEPVECRAKDCGSPPVIFNGNIALRNANMTTYGSDAVVNCDINYIANVSTVSCQSSGVWESAACESIDCGPPPVIPNGNIALTNVSMSTYGSQALVNCDVTYVANVSKITCQSSGVWEVAECVRLVCESVPAIQHGKIIPLEGNVISLGASANVICDTGYETNSSRINCQSSGKWETTMCSAKDCGPPPVISNGNIALTNVSMSTYGSQALVNCDINYVANVSKISCQSSGVWQEAECVQIDCGPPPVISNGNIALTNVSMSTSGSQALVNCDVNYVANVSKITCQSSGIWETAKCAPIVCGPVPRMQFGMIILVDSQNISFGAKAKVICDTGYVTDTPEVRCQTSGTWETTLCKAKDCGPPPAISNGNITLQTSGVTTYGSEAVVSCDVKYVANISKVTCQSSGVWETASCVTESQLSYDRCSAEHGVCTQHIYENVRLKALKSSKCKTFCHCAHASTLRDGSVTYKWVEHNCPSGTLFDESLPSPVCNHAYMVWC